MNADAVGLHRTVAAALTDPLVDVGAPGRIRKQAPFPATALFGCASLIVDDCADAAPLTKVPLQLVQVAAVVDGHTRVELVPPVIFLRFVGDYRDRLDPLSCKLAADLVDAKVAFGGLPAGHGHRVVVEHFVGDIRVCSDGRAYRQNARMGVGAIT